MIGEKEIRCLRLPVQIEERSDGSPGMIFGHAAVFDKDSEDMGFIERIAPGAFKKALKRSDVRGLKNHDPNLIFGRQGVNLTLREDDKGLYYEAKPIGTANFREVWEEIKAGLLTGQSFAFTILADEWRDLDSDLPRRTITEVGELFDVGPVTYPAYTDTTVAVRSLERARRDAAAAGDEGKKTEDDKSITITVGGVDHVFGGEDGVQRAIGFLNAMSTAAEPDAADDSRKRDDGEPGGDPILERIQNIVGRYER